MFKIVTWNINSIKVRLSQLLDWISKQQPDVFCLQETKSQDKNFPFEAIEKAGYFAVFSGQKTFNGVAVLSKKKPTEIITDFPTLKDTQRRILAVTIGGWRILNLYVPNGSEVGSAKYDYKLEWLNHLKKYLKDQLKHHKKIIVVGDFNIAPEDRDVYDPKAWAGRILVSHKERAALQSIEKLGLTDLFRKFHQEESLYSWWDYRTFGFQRNAGLRLDLILTNDQATKSATACDIDIEPRKSERPSDHTPVVAVFK